MAELKEVSRKAAEIKSLKHRGTVNTESAKRRESRQDFILARSILLYFLLSTIHFLGASPTLCLCVSNSSYFPTFALQRFRR